MGHLTRTQPCPATVRAILGAVEPEGALLRCGCIAGHVGDHEFKIQWRDPDLRTPREAVVDEVERYLASRRLDPDFQRRLRERMATDAEILKRLAEPHAAPLTPSQPPADHGDGSGAGGRSGGEGA